MPPALKNQPELSGHLLGYLDAYNSLRCHRTRSEVGFNPIGYSDLVTYARVHGFAASQDSFYIFETLLQACDHAFLEYAEEQRVKALRVANKKTN